jgi:hypothetical protein
MKLPLMVFLCFCCSGHPRSVKSEFSNFTDLEEFAKLKIGGLEFSPESHHLTGLGVTEMSVVRMPIRLEKVPYVTKSVKKPVKFPLYERILNCTTLWEN